MHHTILIVEDEEDILLPVQFAFEAEGFSVLTAMDGAQALEVAKNAQLDVILLDLNLPTMDGLAVCRCLKDAPATADIPVVMASARTMKNDQMMGTDLGAAAYVTKPYNLDALIQIVTEQLRD